MYGQPDAATMTLQGSGEVPTSVLVNMKDCTVTVFSPVSGDSDVPTVFKIEPNGNFTKVSRPLNAEPIGDGVTSIRLDNGGSVNLFPSYNGGPVRIGIGNDYVGAQVVTNPSTTNTLLGARLYG